MNYQHAMQAQADRLHKLSLEFRQVRCACGKINHVKGNPGACWNCGRRLS